MSAIRRGEGDGARDRNAEARVTPANEAISARPVYPLLMIGGVYRASFAMGLAVYALPACVPSPSHHRARLHVRRARQDFRQTFTQLGADISPRPHEGARQNNEPTTSDTGPHTAGQVKTSEDERGRGRQE